MLKIRRSRDRLILNMGIPILVRHLYIETASWRQNSPWYQQILYWPSDPGIFRHQHQIGEISMPIVIQSAGFVIQIQRHIGTKIIYTLIISLQWNLSSWVSGDHIHAVQTKLKSRFCIAFVFGLFIYHVWDVYKCKFHEAKFSLQVIGSIPWRN